MPHSLGTGRQEFKEGSLAMESSMGVMSRALVMLTCLVVIPLIAIFGKSLPEVFKTKLLGNQPAAAATGPTGSPSQFQPMVSGPPAAVRPAAGADFGRPMTPVPDRPMPPAETAPPQARPVVPAGYNAPATDMMDTTDRFLAAESRLRQLGATHCLLESWGNDGHFYRFRCEMAVGGNPDYARYFEATDSNPAQVIGRVLRQVEVWRSQTP